MENKNITNNQEANKMENKNIMSIIDIAINGKTSDECVEEVRTRLTSVERSVFNIAVLCAYGTGVTIPAHIDAQGNEHAQAICDDAKKQVEFVKLVGRAKSTINTWIKAMNLVIENCVFNSFASGLLPFSYDKIIFIYGNEELTLRYNFTELMGLSMSQLEDLAKRCKNCNSASDDPALDDDTDGTDTDGTDTDGTGTDGTDTDGTGTDGTDDNYFVPAEFVYNGITYIVDKNQFEKWLEDYAVAK